MGLFDGLFRRSSPNGSAGKSVVRVGNLQGIGQRERQEDSFAIANASDLTAQSQKGLFAAVADGMGGMADGKQASEYVVNYLFQRFAEKRTDEPIPHWFSENAYALNDEVYHRFNGKSGTTLVCVQIFQNRLHWLSVGDSAIFLLRGGGVFQINREHTYLNQLYMQEIQNDTINKIRAEQHPDARRLTAFIGIDHLQEIDQNLRPFLLHGGDSLLLCSDGISGVLTPPELREPMSMEPAEGCALLERMLLEKGCAGQDNYTGILISYN